VEWWYIVKDGCRAGRMISLGDGAGTLVRALLRVFWCLLSTQKKKKNATHHRLRLFEHG
jgi:hypothetical protein